MIAGLIIVLFMGATWRQAGYWKDSITLFERAIKVTSDNFIAHYNLANVLAKQGRMDEAVGHYHQTISINPNLLMRISIWGMSIRCRGDPARPWTSIFRH